MMSHFGEFVDPNIDYASEQFFASARSLQAKMFTVPRTLVGRYAEGLRSLGVDFEDYAWMAQMVDRQSTASMDHNVFLRLTL